MENIIIKPIGIVNSPYKGAKDIPIQGIFKSKTEANVELFDKYKKGLTDLDGFSHAILIYYFNKSDKEKIIGKPFLENKEHGVFAIRSPNRPNNLGISIVKISRVVNNKLYFTQVDIFDKTPLIDIKPYVKYFDSRDNVKSGWIDKHFINGVPKQTILK